MPPYESVCIEVFLQKCGVVRSSNWLWAAIKALATELDRGVS